jgi:hypothetical protein
MNAMLAEPRLDEAMAVVDVPRREHKRLAVGNFYFLVFRHISIFYTRRRYTSCHGKVVTSDQICRAKSGTQRPGWLGGRQLAIRLIRCGTCAFIERSRD